MSSLSDPSFSSKTISRDTVIRWIAERLPDVKIVRHGDDWRMPCPIHKGKNPESFSINVGNGGIWHCHSACNRGGTLFHLEAALAGVDYQVAVANLRDIAGQNGSVQEPVTATPKLGKIVAEYDYTREDGSKEFQVVRYAEPKDFRQRHRDERGNWVWNLKGCRRLLYRLHKVCSAPLVIVTEGEKDVHTIESLGFVGTCNPMGAGKWLSEYTTALRSKEVVIVPDNDEEGLAHARIVLAALEGQSASVRVVHVPEGKDVSEWMALGGSREAFQKLINGEPPVSLDELLQSDHTDAGNEECFLRLHGRNYLYNWTAKQWLHWSGVFWRPDTTGQADRHMLEVAEMRLQAAFGMPESTDEEKEKKEAIEKAARQLRNVKKRSAALESARSNRSFAKETKDFDTKHDLFCCGNGVIDLRSGKLRPGHRSDFITKNTPVSWDPSARCDRWLEFLAEVFPERPEMWSFLQRAVGYSLTGLTSEEMFFLLWGTGRNGKGTFISTLSAVLGDYAHTCEMSSLTAKKDDPVRNDLAALCGARFVTAQETHERSRLDEAMIKTLTGGDKISARFLFQEFFQFDPTWKLWLATNHKPEIRGTDLAIWSRPKLIPFTVSFEGRENRGLKAELLSPKLLSGVLRWAVEGAVEYYKGGLNYPAEVLQATQEYKAECDLLGRFIEDKCLRLPTAECKARVLYQAYQKWTEEIGESKAMTEKSFSLQLQSRGYKNKRRTDCKYWEGVNLLTVMHEVDDR